LCHIAKDDDHESEAHSQAHGFNDCVEFVS
jgi:hypothetical protein